MQISNFFLNFLVTEWDFAEEYFLFQKLEKNWESGPKFGQKHSFFIYWKIWSLIFTEFVL